jgi:hypothetical protein
VEVPIKAGFAIVVNEASKLSPDMSALDADMIEMALLLPRWQAMALQRAAKQRGMTPGQMLRRMIGDTVGTQPPSPIIA